MPASVGHGTTRTKRFFARISGASGSDATRLVRLAPSGAHPTPFTTGVGSGGSGGPAVVNAVLLPAIAKTRPDLRTVRHIGRDRHVDHEVNGDERDEPCAEVIRQDTAETVRK
ncbi:hypothetical protein GCM10023317_28960 [Actinopolymorpha pittospori]